MVQALLTQHATLQQVRCMLATFSFVNLIANDFAAVQVFEHVQVIKLSTHLGRQIGNIPAPDLARANGGVGCRLFAALWRPALATMVQLSSLFASPLQSCSGSIGLLEIERSFMLSSLDSLFLVLEHVQVGILDQLGWRHAQMRHDLVRFSDASGLGLTVLQHHFKFQKFT